MSAWPQENSSRRNASLEILSIFLRLGCTSFGGPVAHIGYFRTEFVERRKWFDDAAYSELVALCQFLPGPASSQVGFAIGLLRGGMAGALAAWIGLPCHRPPFWLLLPMVSISLEALKARDICMV